MFSEPDIISLLCLLMVYVFSFYSITPLCPYYVCSNPIMIIFSVDGHHLAFFKRTEHSYRVFCNQKQGTTKNVNVNPSGNLYGATLFFPRSLGIIKCTIRHKHKFIHHCDIVY